MYSLKLPFNPRFAAACPCSPHGARPATGRVRHGPLRLREEPRTGGCSPPLGGEPVRRRSWFRGEPVRLFCAGWRDAFGTQDSWKTVFFVFFLVGLCRSAHRKKEGFNSPLFCGRIFFFILNLLKSTRNPLLHLIARASNSGFERRTKSGPTSGTSSLFTGGWGAPTSHGVVLSSRGGGVNSNLMASITCSSH